MPRYLFHGHDGEQTAIDDGGIELSDEAAVREEAIAGARDIMIGGISVGMDRSHWRFAIADESGAPLLMFPLSEAVEGKGGPTTFVRRARR